MDLKPESNKPEKYDTLVCNLLSTQDYVGVSKEESYIFLGDWSLVLTKAGKWRLE